MKREGKEGQGSHVALTVILLSTALFIFFLIAFFLPAQSQEIRKIIEIPPGATLRDAARILSQQNLLSFKAPFILLGKLTGAERRIKPGEYLFHTRMSPIEIITLLKEGKVIHYEVTVPEGSTASQIGRLLAEKGITDYETFISLVHFHDVVRTFGIEGNSLEGYLYPDTYHFTRRAGAENVMKAMVSRFKEMYTSDFERRAEELSMTQKDVVTLASIIEKETAQDSERPLISAVFHNRIRKGMPLQSDPTVIYALPVFHGNLRKADLFIKSPYNTYRSKGLPPGPISNPSRESIRAALYPADAGYIYFVSKNDGTHVFSSTFEQHRKAVRTYQKSLTIVTQ